MTSTVDEVPSLSHQSSEIASNTHSSSANKIVITNQTQTSVATRSHEGSFEQTAQVIKPKTLDVQKAIRSNDEMANKTLSTESQNKSLHETTQANDPNAALPASLHSSKEVINELDLMTASSEELNVMIAAPNSDDTNNNDFGSTPQRFI